MEVTPNFVFLESRKGGQMVYYPIILLVFVYDVPGKQVVFAVDDLTNSRQDLLKYGSSSGILIG